LPADEKQTRASAASTPAWLPGEEYDRLLFEPLEAARKRLHLEPARAYAAVSPADRNLSLV